MGIIYEFIVPQGPGPLIAGVKYVNEKLMNPPMKWLKEKHMKNYED